MTARAAPIRGPRAGRDGRRGGMAPWAAGQGPGVVPVIGRVPARAGRG